MKYLYIQENKDWYNDNKFKYGYTQYPKNRIISEQHSYKSSYIALYECEETEDYIYEYSEYDKIISSLRIKSINEIEQDEIEYNIDLSKFKEIKKYLINNGGGTEFIYSNEGIELLDYIFLNIFKNIGLNIRKLTKEEIDNINEISYFNQQSEKILLSSKINLRDYQLKIINNGIDIITKDFKFYLELATGAGKSTIIYYILNNLILKNNNIKYTIIIFTPRINISSQNINNKYINIFKIPKTKIKIYDNNQIKRIRNFNKEIYNIISCCIQSYQFIYENIIIKYNIDNIIIWFDEAHYSIETWINNYINHYKTFYLNDDYKIKYRLFTSASPNKSIINKYNNIFGILYSPISVRQLIKDKWLTPIKPHIIDFEDIIYDENKYYYYINTILNTFHILNKNIGLNFHNSCKNAVFAFTSHYNKFINSKTNIKPYLLISNEEENKKIYNLLHDNYKYLLDFSSFDKETNNVIAYIVNMYSMGYDNSKIDFLSFADPKLSNKDIIQSIGRGIRSDGLGMNGRNKNKINDIIIPIYNNDTNDKYIKFNRIKEVLQYLIYDIGLDIKDINIYKKSNSIIKLSASSYLELEESKIIANIIKWNIEPKMQHWNLKNITNHLMNNNIHNYNSYLEYISLEENRELNLPLDLFKKFPSFNFNDTYNITPYYNKNECIKAINNYIEDFIENDEIDKKDNKEILNYLHNKDKKIPNYLLWQYYGGSKKEYLIFI